MCADTLVTARAIPASTVNVRPVFLLIRSPAPKLDAIPPPKVFEQKPFRSAAALFSVLSAAEESAVVLILLSGCHSVGICLCRFLLFFLPFSGRICFSHVSASTHAPVRSAFFLVARNPFKLRPCSFANLCSRLLLFSDAGRNLPRNEVSVISPIDKGLPQPPAKNPASQFHALQALPPRSSSDHSRPRAATDHTQSRRRPNPCRRCQPP